MPQYVKVVQKSEVEPGSSKLVEVEGKRIALFNVGGSFCAIGDSCTHRGGPLSEGFLDGETVTCPLHGARFNVKTGEVLGPPAPQAVPCYSVRVEGEDVEIEV